MKNLNLFTNKRSTLSFQGISICLVFLFSLSSLALDINGNGSMRSDAVVLYQFNSSNAGTDTNDGGLIIKDLANPSHGEGLDLKLFDNTSATYNLTSSYFEFMQTNVLRSTKPANKIIEACKSSNELTIELWIQNRTPSKFIVNNESDDTVPIKQSLRIVSLGDSYFKEFSNFAFYQAYNDAEVYKSAIRTSGNSAKSTDYRNVLGFLRNPFLSAKEDVLDLSLNTPQHIVLTKSKGGIVTFYRSDESGLDTITKTVARDFNGDFNSSWFNSGELVSYNTLDDSNGSAVSRKLEMLLSFGNDSSAPHDFTKSPKPESRTFHSRNYPWVGKIYLAAIYCRELKKEELLGDRAPNKDGFEKYAVDLNLTITPSIKKAKKLFEVLNSVATPLYNPRLKTMATLIDENRYFDAAGVAIEDNAGPDFNNPLDTTYYNPSFYNITVRDFAAPLSTREESMNTELNDFIATIIGVVRDNLNAKELLTGNYFYMADPLKAAVPSNIERDIIKSNLHYSSLAEGGFNLARILKKTPQVLYNGTNIVDNPDPAGLLTSRAFLGAHAIAGTNRRIIEYTFREFLCSPIEKWALSQASDSGVGRDIDRVPGGSATKYVQNCRACHTRMDTLRTAFSYYTFSNNYIKNTLVSPHSNNFNLDENMSDAVITGLRTGDPALSNLPSSGNYVSYVVKKLNHNDNVYPGGFVTFNNSFNNIITDPEGLKRFGWRSQLSGKGAHEFGLMISQSEEFSRCLTRRVFKTLCKREVHESEENIVKSVATDFELKGYQLKYLFKKVAILPQCLGQ